MTIMAIDNTELLRHRRKDIASEVHRLKTRLWSLSAEDRELAIAERVLLRFGVQAQETEA